MCSISVEHTDFQPSKTSCLPVASVLRALVSVVAQALQPSTVQLPTCPAVATAGCGLSASLVQLENEGIRSHRHIMHTSWRTASRLRCPAVLAAQPDIEGGAARRRLDLLGSV